MPELADHPCDGPRPERGPEPQSVRGPRVDRGTNECIGRSGHYELRRGGRFLVADLSTPHQVLTTSACGGGLRNDVRHLVNHQSCEGAGHDARFRFITALGDADYHRHVCAECGLPPDAVALMGGYRCLTRVRRPTTVRAPYNRK